MTNIPQLIQNHNLVVAPRPRGASSSLTLHFDAVILEAQIQSKTINNGTDLGLKKRGILQFIEPERI
jgi:hypothetical protein